jgi:pimeloyl-ACP methyl ester carboxylesterase
MAEMRQISIANGDARVRVWSEGEGTPLLFLHGFEGHPGDAQFLRRLAQSRRVYAPEHPGFGESTGIEQIDDVLDMSLYYRQLVELLGLQQFDINGHSLGGMFAAEFAAICPQHVRRLVLVAPFGLWLERAQVPDLFAMSAGQLQRSSWHDPESHAAQQVLSQSTNGRTGIAAAVGRAGNLSAAGKFLWPIPDRGLRKRLPLIKAQTLIITGASDRLVAPAYGEAFAAAIPNAKSVTIANAGHLPMIEQADAFAAAVDPFLDRAPNPQSLPWPSRAHAEETE